jgi:predicted regulator of Ras-like GTPase activity (Roadblock/LC7/MglB family)
VRVNVLEATGLIVRQNDLTEIERALDDMLDGSKAGCVLLINSIDGSLIASRGSTDLLDTTSLAALAAGAFVSTQEIARLVGEPEFTVLFHQGKQHHVHVNVAGERGLLMTLFGDDTTGGLVRLCARKACTRIRSVLSSPLLGAASGPAPDAQGRA